MSADGKISTAGDSGRNLKRIKPLIMRYEDQISAQRPYYCGPRKYMNVRTVKLGQTFSPEDEVPAEEINKGRIKAPSNRVLPVHSVSSRANRDSVKFIPEASAPDGGAERAEKETRIRVSVPTGSPLSPKLRLNKIN